MEQGLLGWPKGGAPGLRVQVDSFAVEGCGPYLLTKVPDGGLVLGFFDGILQLSASFTVNPPRRLVEIAAGVATADVQTFTLVYST